MSQRTDIEHHLRMGRAITPLIAFAKFNCLTLSQRIGEIKRHGFKVKSQMIRVGEKRVASYTLAKL